MQAASLPQTGRLTLGSSQLLSRGRPFCLYNRGPSHREASMRETKGGEGRETRGEEMLPGPERVPPSPRLLPPPGPAALQLQAWLCLTLIRSWSLIAALHLEAYQTPGRPAARPGEAR